MRVTYPDFMPGFLFIGKFEFGEWICNDKGQPKDLRLRKIIKQYLEKEIAEAKKMGKDFVISTTTTRQINSAYALEEFGFTKVEEREIHFNHYLSLWIFSLN